MVSRQRRARKIAVGQRAGLLAAVAVLVLIGVYYAATNLPSQAHPGGLACSEVQQLRADYQSGDIEPSLQAQVAEHLSACPHCRTAFESPRRGAAMPGAFPQVAQANVRHSNGAR